jgi:FAD/FMN-containing dehydrogenase
MCFVESLIDALGAESVITGDAIPDRHRCDWSGLAPVRPLALVCPRTTDEVAATLRLCHAHGVPVVPQGGLTGLAGAAMPRTDAIALSMHRMNAIETIDTASATMTVQAGATLQAVHEAAAAAGLTCGMDLGSRGSCQIGGNISTNAGGNGVVQFGMMREQTLGLEVVLADGTVLPMLRPMVKNNTGYDLKQWFIGAEGTLGVITRAVLQLHPAADAKATALIALPDYDSAVALLRRLQLRFTGTLAAFELMWPDFFTEALAWLSAPAPFQQKHPLYALIEVTGHQQQTLAADLDEALEAAMGTGIVIDAVVAQSLKHAKALWDIRGVTAEFPTRMRPINFDVSLPVGQIGEFSECCIDALSKRWPQHRTLRFGHIGDSNLHLTTDARSLGEVTFEEAEQAVEQIVYALVAQYGGSISAEHGIGLLKKPFLGASRSDAEVEAMRAIKRALDPGNLLNPGKIFDLMNEEGKSA